MSIKNYVSEFQDYLYNKQPLFDRLDPKSASQSDYFGAHKNAETLLEEYKTNLEFLEVNSRDVSKEVESIFESLNTKIDKVNLIAASIIGINATDTLQSATATVIPYSLASFEEWESLQSCLQLPSKGTLRIIEPYTVATDGYKATARFVLPSNTANRYIKINKKITTHISSISFLNNDKDELLSKSTQPSLGKTEVLVEVPSGSVYVAIQYFFETEDTLSIEPMSYKYDKVQSYPLGEKEYLYGNLFTINSNTEVPEGCYIKYTANMVFKDINGRSVATEKVELPLNSDNLLIKPLAAVSTDDVLVGFWLNGYYTETDDISIIPSDADVVCKARLLNGYSTESAITLEHKLAKTIDIDATITLYSLSKATLSPKIFYLTGITKNV